MSAKVQIGDSWVGDGEPCFITAEIGINHNGDMGNTLELINVASSAGCNAIKFQKRTVNVVYTEEELALPRENHFGLTNGDLKRGLEFGFEEYTAIDDYCRSQSMTWFASCWDEGSLEFMEEFEPPGYKIASASLTDDNLLRQHRECGRPIILSTGMSTIKQIDHAVEILGTKNLIILHCNSTYPSLDTKELNLKVIHTLKDRYDVPVGYSGHEVGLSTSVGAAVLGACMVERHITLDRAMWGSDQSSSLEPEGITRLVRDIREIETAMGDGVKRLYDSEIPVMEKLRRVG